MILLTGVAAIRAATALAGVEPGNDAGESTKALAAYERRVAQQPTLAIEHVRLSDALSSLGLLDRALAEATVGVRLDRRSVPGLMSLADRRESDALGRLFQPGFDRDGALNALRALAAISPSFLAGRYALVTLLEYDTDGVRYSYEAPLAEAAAELLEVRKVAGYADTWDDELLHLLGLTGQFEQIRSLVPGMPLTDARRDWLLAAAFYLGGEKAARASAASISLDRTATRRAFYGAAGALESSRQYDKAKQLMTLASVDRSDASRRADHLQILGRIKRHEGESLDEASPQDAARNMMALLMRPAAGGPRFDRILSRTSRQLLLREPQLFAALTQFGARELRTYTKRGYSVDQAIDLYLSNLNVTVEGSAREGYFVRWRNGSDQQEGFFVTEGGEARLLATSQTYFLAGPEALARSNAGMDDEALGLLKWAGKYVRAATTDDPLDIPVFTHFAGAESVQYAAAALAAASGDPEAAPVLVKGQSAATSYARRLDFDIALAAAYFAQHDWKHLAEVAERLASAFPDSKSAFKYRTSAYRGIHDWEKAEAITTEWLARHKGNADGTLARVFNALYQGKIHDARAVLAPLIAAGSSDTAILNEFAWLSVAGGEVDDEAVQVAQFFGVNHTLACAYALSGRPKEALAVLIEAMGTAGMTAPDSSTWLAQGLIAEAYGDSKSAQLYYSRVQPDAARDEDSSSPYNVARRRSQKLGPVSVDSLALPDTLMNLTADAPTRGEVTLRACMDDKGNLTEEPAVWVPSGTANLDAAALKLAKDASGRYTPATQDGKPIASCFGFRIKFVPKG